MELCNSPLSHTSPSAALVFCLTEPSFRRTVRQAAIVPKPGPGMALLPPVHQLRCHISLGEQTWGWVCMGGGDSPVHATCMRVCMHSHMASTCPWYRSVGCMGVWPLRARACVCVRVRVCMFSHVLPCVCVRLYCSNTCLGMSAGRARASVWVCVCL